MAGGDWGAAGNEASPQAAACAGLLQFLDAQGAMRTLSKARAVAGRA